MEISGFAIKVKTGPTISSAQATIDMRELCKVQAFFILQSRREACCTTILVYLKKKEEENPTQITNPRNAIDITFT